MADYLCSTKVFDEKRKAPQITEKAGVPGDHRDVVTSLFHAVMTVNTPRGARGWSWNVRADTRSVEGVLLPE